MARFFFLLQLLLFFLAFSSASVSVPIPQTEDPLPAIDSDDSVSDSDSNPTILLPSQKPISDSQPSHNLDTSDEVNPQSVPLTSISFRPINRHFPWRPFPFPSRFGHHCRHHHDHRFRPLGPRFRPYGNDMILSDEKDPSFHPVIGRDRHKEPRFEHGNDMEMSEDMMMPGHPHLHHHYHHRHRHHDHDHDHDFVDEDGDERRRSWERENHDGLMSKIRLFFFH